METGPRRCVTDMTSKIESFFSGHKKDPKEGIAEIGEGHQLVHCFSDIEVPT